MNNYNIGSCYNIKHDHNIKHCTLLSTSMIEIPSLQELFRIESDMLTSFWPKFWQAYNIWKSGQSTLIRSGQSKKIFAITVLFGPRQRKKKKKNCHQSNNRRDMWASSPESYIFICFECTVVLFIICKHIIYICSTWNEVKSGV